MPNPSDNRFATRAKQVAKLLARQIDQRFGRQGAQIRCARTAEIAGNGDTAVRRPARKPRATIVRRP